MPPQNEQVAASKSLQQLIDEVGIYPPAAYQFVQEALSFTVQKLHGQMSDPNASKHVSGQQLCAGVREYAAGQWGLLAATVLRRWNITHTVDLGRIVFALVEIGQMQKTDQDSLEDFRNVFDFKTEFESRYSFPRGE